MSRYLRWIPLVLLVLLAGVSDVDAQRSWPNDVSGRPAPPCTTYDPAANVVAFCPPAPGAIGAGGTSGTGAATTIVAAGGTTTAFGNTWFNGTIAATPTLGLGCVYQTDVNLTCVGQVAGSATGIRVYQSVDGGRTLPLTFTTNTTPGNMNQTGQMVKTATGQYWLGLIANGGVGNDPLVSSDLTIWTATSGVNIAPFAPTGTFLMAAGGPAGNTVLALPRSGTGDTRICRTLAPSIAFVCQTPAAFDNTSAGFGPTAIQYVTGSTWLMIDAATPAHIFRSTNDAVTWTSVTTLTGTSAASTNNLTCVSATICLAQKGDSLYRSIDAGLTWLTAGVTGSGGAVEWLGVLNYGGGNVEFLGNYLNATPGPPDCGPSNCPNILGNSIRTVDGGLTWVAANTPWLTTAGTGRPYQTLLARSNGSAVAIHGSNNNGPAGTTPTTPGGVRNYGYTTATPSGVSVFSHGEIPVAGPVQAGALFNTQTTGAATTAVTVTITGVSGLRVHVYEISARCNTAAATATVLSVVDGAITLWSAGTSTAQVVAATDFTKRWGAPGLTLTNSNSAVITAGACTAGTTTLQIQADQF